MTLKKITSALFIGCLLSPFCSAAEPSTTSHAIAMHGEPKYQQGFKHFEYTSLSALKGGTLKQGLQGTFDSLNPFIAKGSGGDQISLIYDTLTTRSGDEAFTQYGLIAESIEIPDDRSWVIYHLRKEARFHDGEPIQADDVIYTFNLLIEKGNPLYRSYYGDVETVTAIDNHTVKFSFKPGIVNRELALIVGELVVLPKHFWEQRDFSKSTLELPLGSGPYKITSANAGRSLVYERVEDYWAKDLPVNVGLYNFDRIQLDYYKDAVVLLEALKSGQYDFRVENYSKQWATGYSGTAIDQGLLIKQKIDHENPTGMQAFTMNLRNPLFQDIKVRMALTYAFDFEWSNKNLFFDAYTRTDSFFSNSELASSGVLQGRELEILSPYKKQLPASVFDQAFTLPNSNGDGYNRQNLRKAMKLLKEAGWAVTNNQLVNKETGQAFTFELIIVQPSFERVVNPFKQTLKKLGIDVTVKHVEISQYINRMRTFDYDMVVGSIGASLSPGNEQIEFWHSSAADRQASRNLSGVKNPVVDELIALIINAPDREELIVRTRALDRVLLNNYYVIPQWHIGSHRLAYWDKFGQPEVSPKYDPNYQLGLLSWWIDSNKLKITTQAKQQLTQ